MNTTTAAQVPGTAALIGITRDGEAHVVTLYAGSDLFAEQHKATELEARQFANQLWMDIVRMRNDGSLPAQFVETAPVVAEAEAITKAAVTTPGVFELDGQVYLVKPNKAGTRVYACRLVSAPPRLMENGDVRNLEWEYDKGAIFKLTEANRMSVEDAEAVSRRYGRCMCCGRGLKAAASVKRMIGPVCIKKYWG